jgi:transcriptional regulator with XRE-family HTH domain
MPIVIVINAYYNRHMYKSDNSTAYMDTAILELAMQRAGIASLSELCQKAGIHRNSLAPYLKQERSPYSSVFEAICVALNISPKRLLRFSDKGLLICVTEIVHEVVNKFSPKVPGLVVVLFGSRAQKDGSKKWSDFDLGLTLGSKQLCGTDYLAIQESILSAADDLPTKIDVVNLDAAPVWFLKDIALKQIEYLAGDKPNFRYLEGKLHAYKEIQTAD